MLLNFLVFDVSGEEGFFYGFDNKIKKSLLLKSYFTSTDSGIRTYLIITGVKTVDIYDQKTICLTILKLEMLFDMLANDLTFNKHLYLITTETCSSSLLASRKMCILTNINFIILVLTNYAHPDFNSTFVLNRKPYLNLSD